MRPFKVIKTFPVDEPIIEMQESDGTLYVATPKRVFRMRVEEGEEKFTEVSFEISQEYRHAQ